MLHWAIGLLIVVNYFVADGLGEMLGASLQGKPVSGGWHVWIGTMRPR